MVKRKSSFFDVFSFIWGFVASVAGFIVSLAVGFGMIDGLLKIPYLSDFSGNVIVIGAGWIVVALSLIGVFVAVVDRFSN